MKSKEQCLVVCGNQSSVRIGQAIIPHLDFPLKMVAVVFKEELLETLSVHQPPLCVLEWQIHVMGIFKTKPKWSADGTSARVPALRAPDFTEYAIPAHEVFDDAWRRSPNTRFIIACHNKGYDVVKAHADDYKHPAVIKRMGFINGLVNMRYLAKLFTRTYAGRTWKPTF